MPGRRTSVATIVGIGALTAGLLSWPGARSAAGGAGRRAGSAPSARGARPAPHGPYCTGAYADELSSLSPAGLARERARDRYTFCVRSTAVYECPSYGSDGTLRRRRAKVVQHGTGFAYRRVGAATLLATNEHVADWPSVTDREHPVDGVAEGCKLLSGSLELVDNEYDRYTRDDIPVTRVVADPQLDVAVLRAEVPLSIMPWKIGRSAALTERNAVTVRGFPLGALQADSAGKVVSAHDHDDEGEWDHDDFVVDALLSRGNSGSPVFAVSCETGLLELVGIYHAAYEDASALNLVVGIDQVRSLLETLRRAPPSRAGPLARMDGAERASTVASVKASGGAFFPVGDLHGATTAKADGTLVYALAGEEFPVKPQPILLLEDLPGVSPAEYGRRGRLWVGNGVALRELAWRDLEGDVQGTLDHLLEAMRRDTVLATAYRAAAQAAPSSRARADEAGRLEHDVRRLAESQSDLAQAALEAAERLSPPEAELSLTTADALRDQAPGSERAGRPLQREASAPRAGAAPGAPGERAGPSHGPGIAGAAAPVAPVPR